MSPTVAAAIAVLWILSVAAAFIVGRKRSEGMIRRTFSKASRAHHAKQARSLADGPDVAALDIPVDAPAWGGKYSYSRRPERAQKLHAILERGGIKYPKELT